MANGRRTRRQVLTALVQQQDQPSAAEFDQDDKAWRDARDEVQTLVAGGAGLDEVQRGAGRAVFLLHAFANKHAAALARIPNWPAELAVAERATEALLRLTPETAGNLVGLDG